MREQPNGDVSTGVDAVDMDTREIFSRFREAKRERPKSMQNRERRRRSPGPGSIRQRRKKHYF